MIDSVTLCAGDADDLISALGSSCTHEEAEEIRRLVEMGLPPVTSDEALAVLSGYNRGFLWFLLNQPEAHYRVFNIPKGRSVRQIEAPRVTLKFIQKWLSIHFEKRLILSDHVHGFVKGRSHITAAQRHLRARWVISVDIENFFPSTNLIQIRSSLKELGYKAQASLDILSRICSFRGRLSQGAPTSPVIANAAMKEIDDRLIRIAEESGSVFTRYADDIVFSGKSHFPEDLMTRIDELFRGTPWKLSDSKRSLSIHPARLKVHGLLVHGNRLRLTKGYRNRIRALIHLNSSGRISPKDTATVQGHLGYAAQIDRANHKQDI